MRLLISRYEERPRLDFWPIGVRDPLPVLGVPLAAPDPDVKLDLRLVLDRAYDAADYGKYIYQEAPEPRLAPEVEAWAKQFIPQHSSPTPLAAGSIPLESP